MLVKLEKIFQVLFNLSSRGPCPGPWGQVLVLVLVFRGQVLVLVLVLGGQVLVLVLGGQVLVLVLVLLGQVLVNIPEI